MFWQKRSAILNHRGIYVYPTDELFSKNATIRLYGSHILLFVIFLLALTLFNALLTAAKTTTPRLWGLPQLVFNISLPSLCFKHPRH
jgi:hypothetical protein